LEVVKNLKSNKFDFLDKKWNSFIQICKILKNQCGEVSFMQFYMKIKLSFICGFFSLIAVLIFVNVAGGSTYGNNLYFTSVKVPFMLDTESSWVSAFVTFLTNNIFNHYYIYLGGSAIVLLLTATILYEINRQRFTRAHGLMAGSAFILTTINVILIVPAAASALNAFVTVPGALSGDWIHLFHIINGIVGYSFGAIAIFTGLGGIRTRLPGYVALICWTLNFILGILPLPYGFGLFI